VRGPASGRAQEGPRTSPEARSTDFHPTGSKRLRFLQGGSEFYFKSTGVNGPVLERALRSLAQQKLEYSGSQPLSAKLADEINQIIPGWILIHKLEVA
jgi:hypothetical protein